ncbi:hypothetical protein ACXR8F_04915 [Terrabacter sp. AAH1]
MLLPSPLLGPSVWEPVAERLGAAGWSVAVCRQPAPVTTAADALAGFLDAVPAGRPVVLVPHSNAGLFAPEVARQRDVVATVFVDAALPQWVTAPEIAPPGSPERSDGAISYTRAEAPLAPAAFLDFLQGLADPDGVLPAWTRWWPEADVDVLFPDRATRRRVEQEQQRLPLTYFRDTVTVPAGWADRSNAYLAFGDTYADERRLAEQCGWPVATLPGQHLHGLVAPAEVAAELSRLLGALGVPAPA